MNKLTWTQNIQDIPLKEVTVGVYRKYNAAERCAYVDDMLRDFNVGTQKLRFKVVSVKPLGGYSFRIQLNTSKAAAERIMGVWSSGSWYTMNGKRGMTT